MTATEVIEEAAALLSDPAKTLFTEDKLLPFVKKAYRELGVELHNNGAPLLNEISPVITVPAGAITLEDDQPDDITIPVRLRERGNEDESFIDMIEEFWEPDNTQGDYLYYWTWREGLIHFLGSTRDRQVIIHYKKTLGVIEDGDTTISYPDAIIYLSPRTAALAARHIGKNPGVANDLDGDASFNLSRLISRTVKGTQSLPRRKKSYWQFLRNRQQSDAR